MTRFPSDLKTNMTIKLGSLAALAYQRCDDIAASRECSFRLHMVVSSVSSDPSSRSDDINEPPGWHCRPVGYMLACMKQMQILSVEIIP